MNTTPVGLNPALPLRLSEISTSATAPKGRGRCSDTLGGAAAKSGLEILQRASRGGSTDAAALDTALGKMSAFNQAAACAESVDSAVCEMMIHQSKQSNDQKRLGALQIKSHFQKMKQQNLKAIKEIQDRIKARRKASKWGFWGKIFKAVAAAFSAVSSIFTGPVGMAGAALLVGALVVSVTVKGSVGQWLSLGLSLAGAALTLGSSFWGEALKGAEKVANVVCEIGSAASNATAGGTEIGKGAAERDALEAQAALQEIKAMVRKLLGETEEEREEIETVIEAETRCMQQVTQILETNHQTHMAHCRV